jgi:hypothetical protein
MGIRVQMIEQPRVFDVKAGTRRLGEVRCWKWSRKGRNTYRGRMEAWFLCPDTEEFERLGWAETIQGAARLILERACGYGSVDEISRRQAR